jgi:hypothetical protein
MCAACEQKGYFDDPEQIAAMRAVSALYRRLNLAATAGDFVAASALVDEGLSCGLRIPDLAWGVVQPLLYRVGQEWAAGKLSVANEHLVSASAASAVELLIAKAAKPIGVCAACAKRSSPSERGHAAQTSG